MNKLIFAVSLITFSTIIACCDQSPVVDHSLKLKDSYNLKSEGLYPEGIDFDTKNNVFVLGSFYKGTVHTLSADGRVLKTLAVDPNIYSVVGVYTDEDNDRYIVASGDAGASLKSGINGSTAGSIAYVSIYNAKTGSIKKSINLKTLTSSTKAFPNDIALDKEGNIYITDSFSPIIYKIDKNYNTSIFTTNSTLFTPASGSFGLNGIIYKDNYLIVAKTSDNKLFKIPINSPAQVTEIGGLNNEIKAPDGLEWGEDGNLIVVENGLAGGKVFKLNSSNNWTSASIISQENIGALEFPTTAVSIPQNGLYILKSQLGALLNGDNTKAVFEIKKSILK